MGNIGRITLAMHLVYTGDSQSKCTHRATSYILLSNWPDLIN
jgi:hypothetical protein